VTESPKVRCLGCGKPGTVLREGRCARCTARSRWNGPSFTRVVYDEFAAFSDDLLTMALQSLEPGGVAHIVRVPCTVQYAEDDNEPTEPHAA
jgi:hypothetical protein